MTWEPMLKRSASSASSCAGQGGHVHCWSLGNDPAHVAMSSKQLPAASFGGIAFPDIHLLESAGKDCILGCSSIGSVALWNHAKYALCS